MQYRRNHQSGGCFFFTVVTHQRKKVFNDISSINLLRKAFSIVKRKCPFTINAIVILPDHLHCIWTLPETDPDFSNRWRLIKTGFTKHSTFTSAWQKRFWEHRIRDEKDYEKHVEYIHYNPAKHGHALRPIDWPYSSFHRFVEKGIYPKNWGSSEIILADDVGNE